MLPPASVSARETLITGPQEYCNNRAYHRVQAVSSDDAVCQDCGLHGNRAWARRELRAQGDFLEILGQEIEGLLNQL